MSLCFSVHCGQDYSGRDPIAKRVLQRIARRCYAQEPADRVPVKAVVEVLQRLQSHMLQERMQAQQGNGNGGNGSGSGSGNGGSGSGGSGDSGGGGGNDAKKRKKHRRQRRR